MEFAKPLIAHTRIEWNEQKVFVELVMISIGNQNSIRKPITVRIKIDHTVQKAYVNPVIDSHFLKIQIICVKKLSNVNIKTEFILPKDCANNVIETTGKSTR